MRRMIHSTTIGAAALAAVLVGSWAARAETDMRAEAERLVSNATASLQAFRSGGDQTALAWALRHGRAVLVVPQYQRIGVGLGGEGGYGVLLRKDIASGKWSYPAFYEIKGGSIGFQIGFEEAKAVFVIGDDKTLDKLIDGQATFGADAGVVAGTESARGGALMTGDEMANIQTFVRSEGAFAGATLKGGMIEAQPSLNMAYYGVDASTRDILVYPGLKNPQADRLRAALAGIEELATAAM